MDVIKNCVDGLMHQQKREVSMFEQGYWEGYSDGLKKAREEFEKNLVEAEQEMLNGMARDFEVEKKDRS